MANVLANSIKDKEHLKAWDEVSEERLNAIDFSALIPLLIDTAPVEMLPYLAEQFNVLGYNGWRYADTEQKQRDMIKNAIPLKKFKGTLWSVKEALKFINVEPITIRKDPYDYYPNGLWRCNGHFTCGNDNPFNFEVRVSSADVNIFSEQIVKDMYELILQYKSGRDLLLAINVDDVEVDNMDLDDELAITVTTSGVPASYVL